MVEQLLVDSLQRRMRTMHSLYYQAVDTMELEHVNHFEREGVLPIAFSLFHYTNMEDVCFMAITGIAPVWNDDRQSEVQMTINDHGKHRTGCDRGSIFDERCEAKFRTDHRGGGQPGDHAGQSGDERGLADLVGGNERPAGAIARDSDICRQGEIDEALAGRDFVGGKTAHEG